MAPGEEKLQEPVGYSRDTAAGLGQMVLGWESACEEESIQGHDLGPGDLQGCECCPVSSSVSPDVGVTRGSWCKEMSYSRAGCSSWMASQCYLLLPLDGEISDKGKLS